MPKELITRRRKKTARAIRPVARQNPDGTVSTVLFQTIEAEGKRRFLVTPTLFPTKEGGFIEPGKGRASFEEAKKRGEVFGFKSKKRAEKFAAGGFKKGAARRGVKDALTRTLDKVVQKKK